MSSNSKIALNQLFYSLKVSFMTITSPLRTTKPDTGKCQAFFMPIPINSHSKAGSLK